MYRKKIIYIFCAFLMVLIFFNISHLKKIAGKVEVNHNINRFDSFSASNRLIPELKLNHDKYVIPYTEDFHIAQLDMEFKSGFVDYGILFADGSRVKKYTTIGVKHENIITRNRLGKFQIFPVTINVEDNIGPVISGVIDYTIMQGADFDALGGVMAEDEIDGDVSGTLTSTNYDVNQLGVQTITVSAVDHSGNISDMQFNLTVLTRPKPIEKDLIKRNNENVEIKVPVTRPLSITCWGDSLVEGTGASSDIVMNGIAGATMPSALAYFTHMRVYNMGVGGQDSRGIAARQGGISMFVNNIVIPESGNATFDNVVDENGEPVFPCLDDWMGSRIINLNPCTIAGIKGTLTYNDDFGIYTFTRLKAGEQISIDTPTQLMTAPSADRVNDILILEIGSNGGWNNNFETLIGQYQSMINHSISKSYIIIGDTDGNAVDKQDWENALQSAFGSHFINMREYLSKNGMSDCDLEPEGEDLEQMKNGEVPYSLKSDYTHLNSYGYWSEGKGIYNKGVELGYWN